MPSPSPWCAPFATCRLRLVRDARPAPPPRNLTRPVAGHPDARLVSTDFLTAMGMRVVVGRGFGPNDGVGQPG